MRSCLSAEAITQLIQEDIPYFDLTTLGLGIDAQPGRLEFYTRHPITVCATEEATRLLETCGAIVPFRMESGSQMSSHQLILAATGQAEALHIGWRIALNLLEYASGIATRTAELVNAVKSVNPAIAVVTTRKVFPGTRPLVMKAIVAGGAFPHRLGLSETVLIFKQHHVFLGGLSGLLDRLEVVKSKFREHKITVEVDSVQDAWSLAKAGIDMIQLDKVSLSELSTFVPALKQQYPSIQVAIAGGITRQNVHEYAALDIDLLVTSSVYFGKPADISASMIPTDPNLTPV